MSATARLVFRPAHSMWRLVVSGHWLGRHESYGFRRRVDAIAFAARRGITIEEKKS